ARRGGGATAGAPPRPYTNAQAAGEPVTVRSEPVHVQLGRRVGDDPAREERDAGTIDDAPRCPEALPVYLRTVQGSHPPMLVGDNTGLRCGDCQPDAEAAECVNPVPN